MAIPFATSYLGTVPFSDTCVQVSLAANTAQTYTVPGTGKDKYQVLFGYNDTANIYIGNNNTAATAGAGTHTALQFVEFRPKRRYVSGGDVLSFITQDTTAYFGFSLRSIPS